MSAPKAAPAKAVPAKIAAKAAATAATATTTGKAPRRKTAGAKTAGAKTAAAKTAAKPDVIDIAAANRNGGASAAAQQLAADIECALAHGGTEVLTAEALQELMAVVCRSYAAAVEAGENFLPLGERSRVTSTDVMVTASGLLKSANLAVFELGMWQSWTGR
jgi:hypothetical protein